jgi:hypothetical protein
MKLGQRFVISYGVGYQLFYLRVWKLSGAVTRIDIFCNLAEKSCKCYSLFFPQVKKLLHDGQEVVIIGGTHSLHHHEKLSIAVSKAMRGHSLQETKNDGRFHVHTKTYLDGAILKEVGAV